jgi:peptidyl-prolyl cis-trans isomerase A (cyclophilin A)
MRGRGPRWLGVMASLILGCSEPSQGLQPPSLEYALAGLAQGEPIQLVLHTSAGEVRCALDPGPAPRAVALFVGLARGRATWRDPAGRRVQRPLYRDIPFFRAIPNALLQSGCPVGNGTGHPGYRLPVERGPDDAERLRRSGALLLAHYRPAPGRSDPAAPPPGHVIGSQFAITLTDMSHLAGKVSVIGACRDLERVAAIAERVARHQSVRLRSVSFPGSAPPR